MMLFVILGEDGPDATALRKNLRSKHLDYVKVLQNQGRLVLAGPRPKVAASSASEAGYYGSLIIAEFLNLAAARAWAEQDPYYLGGVFQRLDVQPFQLVLPG